jgi:hypothetical protein
VISSVSLLNASGVDFGGGPVTGDAALVRLASADGPPVWSKPFPQTGYVFATPDNGFLFTASLRAASPSTVDLGCGPLPTTTSAAHVVAQITSEGSCAYSMPFTGTQTISAAATPTGGGSVVAGTYSGTLTFGTTSLDSDAKTNGLVAVFAK